MKLILFALVACGFLAGPVCHAQATVTGVEAQKWVEDLAQKTMAAVCQKNKSPQQGCDVLRKILREFFEVDAMAHFILGRFRRQATEAEWKSYVELFEGRLLHLYRTYFSRYQPGSFVVKGSQAAHDGERAGWMVKSHVLRANGKPLQVDWVVFMTPQGFRISDLQVSGMSLKLQQRDDYLALMQRNGGTIGGLVRFLAQSAGRPLN